MRMQLPILAGLMCGIILAGCSGGTPRACTAPKHYWQKPHNFLALLPEMDMVALDHAGGLFWNGRPVSHSELSRIFREARSLDPQPTVFLETEMGAPCDALDALREQMGDELDCKKSRQCAEGIQSVWSELPSSPGNVVS